ncbi:hypothetical protein DYB36_004682 [Aphanomyces astaci]|uniref:Uncharacterized protein n=1 Tax=Aphanomyces astaci TaxID=112090 RepID=A0A397BXT6_APHAT|nr:hypothetical protein DYB36_004682 [Aphanomyces astaci]
MVASVALTCAMLLGANAVLGVTTSTSSSSSTTVSLLVSCPNRTNSSTIQVTVGRPTSVCLSNGSAITSVKVIDKAINLSRRNISVITRLPPFVASMDLTGNSVESILVDAPSYALLSHPEFDLMIEPDQTAKPTSPLCTQPPPRVKDNFICLIAASQGLLLTGVTVCSSYSNMIGTYSVAFVGKYMLGFVVVAVTAYALWQSMK